MVGKSLGPYKILEQLGKGGMGEVWLAEDTRLGRRVAVKVLPAELADDADRRSRFEQEARAAAALNHANIAAIHDVGVEQADAGPATYYMVQEYLQGDTLRDVIGRGPLPRDKALALAIEIGEALRAAHRAGIIHRDLKPENVFVTQYGHAKVLDFGLAKLIEAALPSGISTSASPTMTMAGQMLGTAGYMAPEQVRGEVVDERADLFALGCVLHEMLAGKQAFGGDNVHESLSRILTGEPEPIAAGLPGSDGRFPWLFDKLLAKDRELRYQSAGDIVVDLRRLASSDEAAEAVPAAVPPESAQPRSFGLPIALAVAALLLGALGGWMLKRPAPAVSEQRGLRFDVMLPKDSQFVNNYNRVSTVSPDGSTLAFVAVGGIWLRSLDRAAPELVPGSEGARTPAFSPDSRRLSFWVSGHIKRFTLGESASVIVAPFRERPMGIHWANDDFVYIGRAAQGIWRVAADGGEPEQLLAVEPGEAAHGPETLPGGEWILYTLGHGVRAWNDASIVAQNLTSNERRVLIERGREVRVTTNGYLIYVQDGTLFAAPFDAADPALTGGSFALGEQVHTSAYEETGAAAYDVSDDGVLAFAPPTAFSGGILNLVWVDRTSADEPLPFGPRKFGIFNLSPDERTIAAEVSDIAGTHIWIFRVDRSSGQRLTTEGRNTFPAWSHDGKYVYFASDRDGDIDIWRRRVDLSEPEEQMLDADGAQMPAAASPDGRWLAYVRMVPSNNDIERLSLSGDGTTEVLIATPADEFDPRFSHDGRFFAYQSNETGRWDIMVHEIASGRRWIVSASIAYGPIWSRNGDSIFYRSVHDAVYRVPVRTDPQFVAEEAVRYFPSEPEHNSLSYDVTRDGKRMLVGASAVESDPTKETRHRISVITNLFAELEKRGSSQD